MPSIPVRLGGDGIIYWVARQEMLMSCTASCVQMIAYMTSQRRLAESFARNLIDVATGMAKYGVAANPLAVDWDGGGAEAKDVMWTLERFLKLQCESARPPSLPGAIAGVGPGAPAVLGINRAEGRHAVVLANQTPTHLVILDPAAGLVLLERDDWEAGDYMPLKLEASFPFGAGRNTGPESRLARVEAAHWGTAEFVITTRRA